MATHMLIGRLIDDPLTEPFHAQLPGGVPPKALSIIPVDDYLYTSLSS